jgi:hypothetical protein
MALRSFHIVATCFAATLVLGAGCGESVPPTPSQQGLKELRRGHYDAAIAICGEAVRLNPQDAEAYLYRGRAHHYRGGKDDLERAIADFSESIRIAPREAEAYYGRALAYRDSGEAEKSAADEKTARQLDSQVREVYAELPDLTPPSALGKAQPDEPAVKPESSKGTSGPLEPAPSDADDLRRFMLLKERFEPGQSGAGSQNKFLPLLSKPRYVPLKSDDDSPLAEDSPTWRSLAPGQPGAKSRPRSGERLRGDASDPIAGPIEPAMPVSPFQRRGSSVLAPNVSRPIQSPFPQPPPRPTGFVE